MFKEVSILGVYATFELKSKLSSSSSSRLAQQLNPRSLFRKSRQGQDSLSHLLSSSLQNQHLPPGLSSAQYESAWVGIK